MSKYEIGHQIPVSGIITITGIAHNKNGTPVYDTDRGVVVPELLIERLEMKPLEKVQPEPKQEPVKLYCFKSFPNLVTAGKIYEVQENGRLVFDNGRESSYDWKSEIPSTWPYSICKLVSRPAKVGEWVYVTHTDYSDDLQVGDIAKVKSVLGRDGVSISKNECEYPRGLTYHKHEYLVLDGYKPEPVKAELEYLNMKVVCVANNTSRWFTTGKVYEVRNGVLNDDYGKFDYNPHSPAKTLEQLNVEQVPKFIEFKGE